jgi:DUF917 family protein
MWQIVESDLPAISIGAAILGTGGGGNPHLGMLRARELLREGRRIRVVDPEDLSDDDLVVVSGGMGSPTVSYEKLARGDEEAEAARALEGHLGQRFTAVAPLEMGGGNSMAALCVGALLDVPVVNGDGMGRAFPELQMITYLIYGGSPAPAAVADDKGNRVVISSVVDARWLERIARSVTIEVGGHAGLATSVMDGAHCKASIIPHTLRLAHRMGTAVLDAQERKSDPVEAMLAVAGGRRYLRGKIVDVERRLARGFARGRVDLVGFGEDSGRKISIDFQNENLVIWEDGEATVTVPDLITLATTDRGESITTEVLRYGYRADVLVLPCPPQLKTERALEVVGPRAFGYDVEYRPSG